LFPGKLLDVRDTVSFCLLKIGNGPHGSFRFQGSIKNIEGREEDVFEGGTAYNNIAKESDRGDGVDQDSMPDEKLV
jgi:hypothetical protein